MSQQDTDEQLLAAFAAGDARAFELLVGRHRAGLWGFLRRMTRDEATAEDLLQETLLRLVRHAETFRGESKVSTWLYSMARNAAVDASRRAKIREASSLDGAAGGASDDGEGPVLHDLLAGGGFLPDEAASDAQLRVRIEAAVDRLPAELREVFLLRETCETPFEEIARIVGCPVGTAKSRMRHALEHLRRALADFQDAAARGKTASAKEPA